VTPSAAEGESAIVHREVRLREPRGDGLALAVAGDLLPDAAAVAGARAAPERHPWRPLVPFIAGHDVAVVGLEAPVTARRAPAVKAGPVLAAPPGSAALAAQGGFTVACLASNHVMDHGPQGLADTLAACTAAGMATVGAGPDLPAATRPLVVERPGLRLALLAVAEREFNVAGAGRPGAAPLDPWATPAAVRRLRDEGHVVVVLVHGGNEHFGLPRPGLVAACRALAAAGAAAVVCSHAHVALPWEAHEGALLAYGLGNFFFPVADPPAPGWDEGLLLSLTLDDGGVSAARLVLTRREAGGGVGAATAAAAAARLADLDARAAVVADPPALAAAWREHCRRRRPYVLADVLGLTRVERRLLRAGVWPWWRLPRRRLPGLYDTVVCDSLREVLETLLEEELP